MISKKIIIVSGLIALLILLTACGQRTFVDGIGPTDPAGCKQRYDPIKQQRNFESCLYMVGISTNNADACLQITMFRDDCLYEVAGKTKNFALCLQIGGHEKQRNCFYVAATETTNPALCKQIVDERQRRECIFGIAIKSSNLDLCEQTIDQRDDCISFIAISTKNPALCEQVGELFKKDCLKRSSG